MRLTLAELAFAGFVALASPTSAHAAWSSDPAVNFPLIVAPGNQRLPSAIPDSAGGALVGWYDDVIDGYQGLLHVQHVLASGNLDPSWPAAGQSAGPATIPPSWRPPAVVSDGSGGVVVGYVSTRFSSWHPFANRLSSSGAVHSSWPSDGVSLCMSAYNQKVVAAEPDASGGAIAVWEDFRGSTGYDIYAARALGNGDVDPGSPFPGVPVCTANGDQKAPLTVPDGAGGAIVFWTDYRTSGSGQIYSHHVLSSGAVDASWPSGGLLVYPNVRSDPVPLADESGGAFVACSGGAGGALYLYHVRQDGTSDPAWPAGGVTVPSSVAPYRRKSLVSDGAGGMIVVWADTPVARVRAQHIPASGVIDAAWPAGGRELPGSALGINEPTTAVPDGSGGIVIVWSDERLGDSNQDIYAHHVLANGALDPTWPADGQAICTAPGYQGFPALVAAPGGAIAIWEDSRSGADKDLYAHYIPLAYPVAVESGTDRAATRLSRVTPNPARSHAKLEWSLASPASARLVILDVSGRKVREIAAGTFDAGPHAHSWDLADDAGRHVSPGLYFASLEAGGRSTKRFVVQR